MNIFEILQGNDRVRYIISPTARKEVLRRLLALNYERVKTEQTTAVAISAKKTRLKKKSAQPSVGFIRMLPKSMKWTE